MRAKADHLVRRGGASAPCAPSLGTGMYDQRFRCGGQPLGLLPYRFEPTSHDSDTSSESDSDSVLPADLAARTRIGNTAWCSCTKCAALPTERECCCCRELAHIRHLFSDVEGLQCITDHPEFVGACLNPLTLRIFAYHAIGSSYFSYLGYICNYCRYRFHKSIEIF